MITENINLQALAEQLCQLCAEAGAAIVQVYQSASPLAVSYKADDSPLTAADTIAEDIIVAGLAALTPHWPILSEEQQLPDFALRQQWPCYWLVDPLDGTREFVERTGEFTINIALIEHGRPQLGVIYRPVQAAAYVGVPSLKVAFKLEAGSRQDLHVSVVDKPSTLRVLTSSRHQNQQLTDCIALLERRFAGVYWLKAGSAVKFCRLAEGEGDIYPRFSPCCEWDIAAGQALLEAAGGSLLAMDFKPFRYNQQPSVLCPPFYALGGRGLDWPALLRADSATA
jgi:3'(2'), 5'-bisphosphate nucleotidase